jgi:hypothetical protein
MAIHDALELEMLTRPSLIRRTQEFDVLFDEFMDEVTYWTTQLEVRQKVRSRRVNTILALPDGIKRQIHSFINQIREAIGPIELKPEKKEALYARLNALADEVDRDRRKPKHGQLSCSSSLASGGKLRKS